MARWKRRTDQRISVFEARKGIDQTELPDSGTHWTGNVTVIIYGRDGTTDYVSGPGLGCMTAAPTGKSAALTGVG